jgi:hypothetical protein
MTLMCSPADRILQGAAANQVQQRTYVKNRGATVEKKLEPDRRDEPQDVVPVALDQFGVDVTGRTDCPVGLVRVLAALEDIETLPLEILDPGCVREAEQMHRPEDRLGIAVRVRGVDVALDHVVVHQAVDDVGTLSLGGADDGRVEQQVPLVDEAVDADAFALAEVLE